MPVDLERPPEGRISPLVYLATNWITLTGIVVVTTAAIFWLFLLPTTMQGEAASPYIGILAFLVVPAAFFLGLVLIPLGVALERRRRIRAGLLPAQFPPLNWSNRHLRRLVYFLALTTFANLVIASQVTYEAVNYMDSVGFCGQTCHAVMQPEFTAFQNSPHARLQCVQCHIGPGASWFVRSKLTGVGQVFAVAFHSYPTPIPTPVRNLRPARETCETCHWPQKYGENRIRVIWGFKDDEANTLSKTVLLMKIGGGNQGVGIHGTHLGPGVRIRYTPMEESRQTIGQVEYTVNGRTTVYAPADPSAAAAAPQPAREMDCMDCHNRPSHSFQMPERALDSAMQAGLISPALPFAKKQGVEILRANYLSQDQAAQQIPAAFERFYRDKYPAIYAGHKSEVQSSARQLLEIYSRNVFPAMKVTWGTYPNNLGHTDAPGCFRCHDGSHAAKGGDSISQDCNACHNLLASDEPNPKVLGDLGIVEKQPAVVAIPETKTTAR